MIQVLLIFAHKGHRDMLGNLDNEVIFKKAFTDKIVFKAFVHDILGIDIEVDKIETEKRFQPKVGRVDFSLDIFAESVDKRVIVEIQRVPYDYNFDRFLHYFLMAITEQQESSRKYNIERTVYVIVVMTAPYRFDTKKGDAVRDEVLLLKMNPKTLAGIERDLYGHQLVCLNPNHPDSDTPPQIRDWLDLIYQSMHSPERPMLNERNPGVKRAASLIDYTNLTPEERSLAKDEASKVTFLALEHLEAMKKVGAKLKASGIDIQIIIDSTGLSREDVEAL
ncbi:MAG: PD-(D/E)XK nuclease family transposase [Bacteroidia bacterium]